VTPTPRELGSRAFGWIVAHEAEFFTPGDPGDPLDRRRLKYLSEVALIAGTLQDDFAEAPGLLARAWAGLDGGERIARALAPWPIAATIYAPFLLAGCRSPALEARLAAPSWLPPAAQLPPFVRFAIGFVLETLAIPRPWDDGEAVVANNFFAPPEPGTPAVRAVLLAHAIMWRTAMGRTPAGLDPAARARYQDVSPRWHRELRATQLLDPLGEVIIADRCAAIAPAAASLELLCRAQRADGAMPPRPDDPIATFEELYHPTCVAALAGTMAAQVLSAPAA
jgi:hypothetical protein